MGKPSLTEVQSILRSPAVERKPSDRRRSVHFEPPNDLQKMLLRFANDQSNFDEIEGLLTHIKNLQGDALIAWLQELQESIPVLKPKLERFVLAVLKVDWASQDLPVVNAFKNFIINLISGHPFYTKPVIVILLKTFVGQATTEETRLQQEKVFRNIHNVIQAIVHISPLTGRKELLSSAKECLPYIFSSNVGHTSYIANLLKLTEHLDSPEDRVTILRIVVERLVELDVHVPKNKIGGPEDDSDEEEMFSMDCDVHKTKGEVDMEVAQRNLDEVMLVAFRHIDDHIARGNEVTKRLYFDLLNVFETQVLPTYALGHVQFLMFYIVADRHVFYVHFLDWCWKKVSNPNTSNIIRQSAVGYIASLIARAKFINIQLAAVYLERLVGWIHAYIRNYDSSKTDFLRADIKAHGPFYAVCQSAMYIFAFRHDEFVHDKKLLAMLRNLSFNTIVTSPLNPLRVCLPSVVKNFNSIARNYQLAYCDTIIQRNNRINLPVVGNLSGVHTTGKPLLLDSFFPFDPYVLKQTKHYIDAFYREYKGAVEEESDEESEMEDGIDDIVNVSDLKPVVGSSNSAQSFLYGTSPGFKY